MVEVGTGDKSSRFLKEEWPIEEGLVAGSTKTHGRQTNLTPTEGSIIPEREKVLL